MIILSIETSCDETAAAIVKFSKNKTEVLANIVSSQVKTHSKFGGVVPALAARMHLKNMIPVLNRAFKQAEKHTPSASQPPLSRGEFISSASQPPLSRGEYPSASQPTLLKRGIHFNKNKIDYIAVTRGPGLIPALMVGVSAAKTLAYSLDKPLVGVNHLEGHIYANWLKPVGVNPKSKITNSKQIQNSKFKIQNSMLWEPEFPVLCLIVSGGHTQLVLMKKNLNYKIIGETLDDAVGEAFDKVAKLLSLSYPGGPMIEKMAKKGDKNKFNFPRPMMYSKDYNFSFSGLKTAVLYEVRDFCDCRDEALPRLYDDKYKADIAASFQEAVIDVLISKTIKAAKEYKVKNIILGGGVSANKELQRQLKKNINKELPNTKYQILNTKLTADNALMIAIAAYYNIINDRNIKSWKNVKADANLRLK